MEQTALAVLVGAGGAAAGAALTAAALAHGWRRQRDAARAERDRLAGQVEHLTAALATAQAAADSDRQSKAQFIATMSHELRTPLNAIIGFSEIIEAEVMGPVGERLYVSYAGDIRESAVHLLELINTILDVANADGGGGHMAERPVSPTDLVNASLRLMRDRAGRSRVTLAADMDDATPAVMADEGMVMRMLDNVLSNAVKFTPAGGTVTVSVAEDAAGGLAFRVTDTGIGMAEEALERIFDPFFQVDGRLNRHYEGAGLGLALTRALLLRHGGTIALDSAPGRGTTVSLRFPPERVLR
ncbi:signal transduction histidine kinase [Azospirillum fermentarium]|uniref:sensor histidine kinase n=1 Tax=Azospirillum fermentarium TaxID=1233114 RepID=UPI0022272615|nr:HAMP domain-containing sensor histidine kinase [Azospirillum fermentarium]MCW2245197.1 signal transduction histidine kinase [Azospirillum fermentarium]